MFGKIFDSMYDGTIAEDWRALITFQQFIVLCDADGTVDMTASSISRRTGIPIEHIKAGIEILEAPDQFSRTPDEEGRRITRLDEHRDWGWNVVNHAKYKALQDSDTVRQQNKIRKQKQRIRERDATVTGCDNHACHPMSRHTDTDTDTDNHIDTEIKIPVKKSASEIKAETEKNDQLVKSAIGFYHEHLPKLPKVKKLKRSSARYRSFIARVKEDSKHSKPEFWDWYFSGIADNDFYNGSEKTNWASFEWFVKAKNFERIVELVDTPEASNA